MILIITIFILFILAVALSAYFLIIRKHHLTSLPNLNHSKSNKILFIFPHPDDEVMASGGLIREMTMQKKEVHVVSTTHGEHGIELLNLEPNELGAIRKKEFTCALRHLGVKHSQLWNYEDGKCEDYESAIKHDVIKYVKEHTIDTIVTYEQAGIYPHPDHISVSRVVRNVAKEYKNITVWYATLPQSLRTFLKLPTKLTFRDRSVDLNPIEPDYPEVKIPIWKHVFAKHKAAKCYKSQNLSHHMPLFIKMLLLPYEYYSLEEDKQKSVGRRE